MKRFFLLLTGIICGLSAYSQVRPFRFALLSDTHIGSPDGKAEEDLRRSIADINQMPDVAFVVLTGDITELGRNEELSLARQILDSLSKPWYIIPGNHDAGWSESGGQQFLKVFGDDKFSFTYAGIRFLGCASGPYMRMSDGHVPRSALNWLDGQLASLPPGQPVIFFNHYPIDNSLDNWYEITDRLHRVHTLGIICGHGHTNKSYRFEDIPGVMCRSNLRARAAVGGFNLVDVRDDSIVFRERKPGVVTAAAWNAVALSTEPRRYASDYLRPDYSINQQYPQVRELWRYSSPANVISTPAVNGDYVVFGNQDGKILALSRLTGRQLWTYQTNGAIFSSPAVHHGRVLFGSADGMVYCLALKTGKLIWHYQAKAAVLGSPLISGDTVYIGGSDHRMLALDIRKGKFCWTFDELDGPVVSTPVLADSLLLFGAWDRNLYALHRRTGKKIWSWNNGSAIRNFSPASCIPVVSGNTLFVVAPDRYISAIDLASGHTLWRNNDATVRESIGVSADGKWIYGKTMQDTVVAYAASAGKQSAAWKLHCGFGYEHAPSMLIEKEGKVFFGTRNGVVYAIDPSQKQVVWAHKIDHSMVNTVSATDGRHVIAATMDGKVVLLEYAQ